MTIENPCHFFSKRKSTKTPAERRDDYLREANSDLAAAAIALGQLSKLERWPDGERAYNATRDLIWLLTPARELVERLSPDRFVQWEDMGFPTDWYNLDVKPPE